MSDEHDLPLEMKYDEARQYYFRALNSDLQGRSLPKVFINRHKAKNAIECQTLDLLKQNQRIIDSHNEVMNMSECIVNELIDDVRINIALLFRISDSLAMLDMVAAFAELAKTNKYCRPELTTTLAVKNCRHPIAERLHTGRYVPNDVYATGSKRLQIVTGCNMSGKSTYIRAIALITVMAQIGCFVPADYASFPLRSQLFARISLDDSTTSNMSTFASEMRETAFILRSVEQRSLVIVDELGRGTSARDGLAIAIAVAEVLAQSRAFVWFVTHFVELPKVLGEREGVVNLHLETSLTEGGQGESRRMAMLYRVADGPETQEHYGLALAQTAGLPTDMLDIAERVAADLVSAKKSRGATSAAMFRTRRRKLLLGLHEQLVQAKDGGLAGEALRQWLKRLQDEFVVRMSALDEQEGADTQTNRFGDGDSAESGSSPRPSTRTPAPQTKPDQNKPPSPAPVQNPGIASSNLQVISTDSHDSLHEGLDLTPVCSNASHSFPPSSSGTFLATPKAGNSRTERISETPAAMTELSVPSERVDFGIDVPDTLPPSYSGVETGGPAYSSDETPEEEWWDAAVSDCAPFLANHLTSMKMNQRAHEQETTNRTHGETKASLDSDGKTEKIVQVGGTASQSFVTQPAKKDRAISKWERRFKEACKDSYLMSGALP